MAVKQMHFVNPDMSITSKEHFTELPLTPIETSTFLAPDKLKVSMFCIETKEIEKNFKKKKTKQKTKATKTNQLKVAQQNLFILTPPQHLNIYTCQTLFWLQESLMSPQHPGRGDRGVSLVCSGGALKHSKFLYSALL